MAKAKKKPAKKPTVLVSKPMVLARFYDNYWLETLSGGSLCSLCVDMMNPFFPGLSKVYRKDRREVHRVRVSIEFLN